GAANQGQLDSYIANGGFWVEHVPAEAAYYKPWSQAYQTWAVKIGLYDSPQPYIFQLYVEPMRRFQLAAEGEGARQPPDHLRARIMSAMDPLPIWYAPLSDTPGDDNYPLHALTQ